LPIVAGLGGAGSGCPGLRSSPEPSSGPATRSSAPPPSSSPGPAPLPPPPAPSRSLPSVSTDWCLEDLGWRGLDEGACYFLADRDAPPSILLVYLSGIVPPVPRSPQKEKVQRIVAAAAGRAPAAAILP